MKLLCVLIPLNVALVSLVALGALAVRGEQPSTVFVLDTSDSEPAPPAASGGHADSPSDSNTRIISDETGAGNKQLHSNQTNHQRQPAGGNGGGGGGGSATPPQSANSRHDKHAAPPATHNGNQSGHAHQESQKQSQPVSSRRLEEAAHAAPAHKPATSQQQQQQRQYKPQPSSTTTTGSYGGEAGASVPKTEERLLISISSGEEPDEPHKKGPGSLNQGGGGGLGGGYDEPQALGVQSGAQQVHHHQKRKPAITISIQDANIDKQNGGSGTPTVILRPSKDGSSFVIATVGQTNDNLPLAQTGNGGVNQQRPYTERPYTEPINNPIQGIIAQHQITSTTRRPPPLNDYNNNNNHNSGPSSSSSLNPNRQPLTSTLTEERPQRPAVQSNPESGERPNSSYEPTSRPPSRPPSEPYSGSSGAQEGREPAPLGDGDQLSSSSSLGSGSGSGLSDEQAHGQQPQPQQGQRKFPLNEKNCGVMHETRIVGGDEADPDAFMWMAAIIKSKPSNNGEPRPFCGGSLITRRHILTAAHCLEGLAPRDVLVRLGGYDFEDSASSSSADFAIDQFRVPAQYSKKTHEADLAIMRLKTPLSPHDQYKTVCMPQPRRSYVGANGLVTGYGSQSQTFRKAAPKLRQVTVPIWENRKCSRVYNKPMGDSFLCAGYEEGGKDACQGDSGGPIMTEGPDQRMMIVGVVSHGIGCGSPGYPGVYTRTTTFADWIEKNTRE